MPRLCDIESWSPVSKVKFSAFSSILAKSFQKTLSNSQGRPSDPVVFSEAMRLLLDIPFCLEVLRKGIVLLGSIVSVLLGAGRRHLHSYWYLL